MNFRDSGKLKAVTFSYDDGTTQDIRMIELLNKYGLKSTFNLNSELLGQRGMLECEGQRIAHYKIHKEDVRSLYEGHEVAVHTLTHPFLPDLDDETVVHQVEQDRINLSELVGYEVVGMAYPCGGQNNDDRVAALLRDRTGVKYSRTIESSYSFEVPSNLYRLNPTVFHLDFEKMDELAKTFLESKPTKPQIFYIWGHAFEMDCKAENWQRLEEFFKLISNKDDIFYGTNTEVLC